MIFFRFKGLLLFLLGLILTGCQGISVQTQYFTHANLASTYVKTPDPRQSEEYIGQQLVISYALPKTYLCYTDLSLHVKVRFKNGEEEERIIPIYKSCGYYTYRLVNQEYLSKGDIITCYVEIIGDGSVLETWKHPLWVELIKFDIKETEQKESVSQ